MQFEINATNAKTVDSDDNTTTIWARDSAGNEVNLVLNERLTKRIIGTAVNTEIKRIANETLVECMENLRDRTTQHERALHAAHSAWYNDIRAALSGRQLAITAEAEADVVITDAADQYPPSVGGTAPVPDLTTDEAADEEEILNQI